MLQLLFPSMKFTFRVSASHYCLALPHILWYFSPCCAEWSLGPVSKMVGHTVLFISASASLSLLDYCNPPSDDKNKVCVVSLAVSLEFFGAEDNQQAKIHAMVQLDYPDMTRALIEAGSHHQY